MRFGLSLFRSYKQVSYRVKSPEIQAKCGQNDKDLGLPNTSTGLLKGSTRDKEKNATERSVTLLFVKVK